MKRIAGVISALLVIQLAAAPVLAEDTVYGEALTSQAGSISAAGFMQGALPAGCTAVFNADEKVISLTNSGSASSTASNCLYMQSWSSNKTDSFVAKANLRFDDLTGNKRIDFRFGDNTYDYVIDLRGNILYVNRVQTELVPEEDKWYTVDICVNKDAQPNVNVYFNGVLAGSYDSPSPEKYTQSGVQLRIETIGKSTAMSVGDVSVFKPGDVRMLIENNVLDDVDSPVKISLDRAIKPNITADNIKVLDETGAEVRISDFVPEYNEGGDISGFTLSFGDKLNKRRVYHAEISGAEGVFGQAVETKSDTFTVIPDDNAFVIGSVRLYSGIGNARVRKQTLSAGFESFDITVRNDGIQSGECVIIAELYDAHDNMIYSGGVKKTIGKYSEVTVNIGTYCDTAPAYVKIRVVDNYKDKNDLADELSGGDCFEA